MAKDERNTYTLQNDESLGEVKIADEVVAIIAALAATEVDGVASMAGNITNEVIGKLGIKNLSKGVKVDVLEGVVTVSLALNIKYNYSIMDVTAKVQDKVKNAVENMTGLEVAYCQAYRVCCIIGDVVRHPFSIYLVTKHKETYIMMRSELREHVFKMLFQIEFNDASEMPEHLKYYFEDLENARDKDKDYIRSKYEAVAARVPEIDELLDQTAEGWKTARMNKVDLTILRLAVYEMRWDDDVPEGVAINEAVELAKQFGGDSSSSFVNGVLGKLARQES